jgi:SAM-dependent methyltransferase
VALSPFGLTLQVAICLAKAPPVGLGFERVLAIDRSTAQLSQAIQHASITYTAGDAYAIPTPDRSVDLITVGQAAHWFDMPRFLGEAVRALQPRGVLAVLGYGVCRLGHGPAQAVFEAYYARLGSHLPAGAPSCYWDCDRRLLDTGMAAVGWGPLGDVAREWFHDRRTLSLEVFEGYLRTWSAYRTYAAMHPGQPDAVSAVMADITAAGAPHELQVDFPFFLVMGRTPK